MEYCVYSKLHPKVRLQQREVWVMSLYRLNARPVWLFYMMLHFSSYVITVWLSLGNWSCVIISKGILSLILRPSSVPLCASRFSTLLTQGHKATWNERAASYGHMLSPLHSNPTPFDLEHRLYSQSPKLLPPTSEERHRPPTFLSSSLIYIIMHQLTKIQLLFMCGAYEAYHGHSDEVGSNENL